MPSKRKKKWGKKSEKRREERKRKVKVKTAVSLLNPKTVEILLSAHARTSQADIMHVDQKAAKCTTCKPVSGKFYLFIARQWPENHSTSFKTRFSAKSPGANGLRILKRSSHFYWTHSLTTQFLVMLCVQCFKIFLFLSTQPQFSHV